MELRSVVRKNKKGDVTDPLVFLIIIGILGISLVILVFTGKTITNAINISPLNDSAVGPVVFEGLNNMNEKTIQFGYAALMAFFIIGIVLSAFLAGEHPVFFFIFFMFTLVGILLSVMFANIYGTLIESPAIAAQIEDQVIFDFTFRNMPKIFVAVAALGTLVMLSRIFGAPRGRGPGEGI